LFTVTHDLQKLYNGPTIHRTGPHRETIVSEHPSNSLFNKCITAQAYFLWIGNSMTYNVKTSWSNWDSLTKQTLLWGVQNSQKGKIWTKPIFSRPY